MNKSERKAITHWVIPALLLGVYLHWGLPATATLFYELYHLLHWDWVYYIYMGVKAVSSYIMWWPGRWMISLGVPIIVFTLFFSGTRFMLSRTTKNLLVAALFLPLFLTPACNDKTSVVAPTYNPFPDCTYTYKAPRPGETINLDVPMRDCVHLSTNVIFPRDAQEKYPVILIRTPYNKGDEEAFPLVDTSTLFRSMGFVTINQDTRGRFDSEGLHVVIKDETQDTIDTLAWLETQPWFDGRLGIWGLSYLAISSIAGAVHRPDLVDAVVVGIMGSDWYKLGSHHGVARADGLRFAAGTATSSSLEGLLETASPFSAELQKFPLDSADTRAGMDLGELKDVFLSHLKRDDFWLDLMDPVEFQKTDLPVYMLTGWFDFQWRNQVEDYNALFKRRQGKDHYLHIGPWPHLLGFLDAHDFDFEDPRSGLEGNIDSALFMQYYVLGEGNFNKQPQVTWYDGGTGQWHNTTSLWPATVKELIFYPASSTDSSCPHRLLSAPSTQETLTYTYDPNVVFEMPGVLTLQEAEMVIETEWCGRTDSLIFETPPFTTATELAGDLLMDLEISTDVEDTPFVARLNLVDTDGKIYNLREGVMLLSHREGDEQSASYTPNSSVSLTVPIPPLRWTLQPGQKLRIGIASSAWPLIVPHPNVAGDDWVRTSSPIIAHQVLHLGTGTITRLRLTVAGQ